MIRETEMTRIINFFANQIKIIWHNKFSRCGVFIIAFFVIIATLADIIAPFDPWYQDYSQVLSPPSNNHWLGTTWVGHDVFSQLVYGTRMTLLVGFLAALISVLIGTTRGLISGYYGGIIDDLLMRFTDIIYSMPFLPFTIVLVALLGPNTWNVIIATALVIWRSNARVIRSEVLSLKQRTFILAAKARGANSLRIIYRHITPNILHLIMLYMALSISWAVLTAASVDFLGFGDPNTITWGTMLHDVFYSGSFRVAWWWFLPPGICLVAITVAAILIGQAFEEVTNPWLKEVRR